MKKIRVGIVGAGQNTTSRHIPGLMALDGVEIVSVCNRSEESSKKVADRFGIAKIYSQWQELVAAKDTDAIVIGTWPYLHCAVTQAALANGKHVLCEARMAMNAAEAHAMLNAARGRPDLVAQLVPAPDTLKVDATIRRVVNNGGLGELLAIDLRAGNSFLDASAPLHWRQDFDLVGYNTMSLGIWYESLMRWIGPATRVMAQGKTYVTRRRDDQGNPKPVLVPEHLDVIAEMACGAQAHLQISKVTGMAGPSEVRLYGTKATLKLAGDRLLLARHGASQFEDLEVPPEECASWRVEEEFIRSIRGQEKVTLTRFEDGVKYMEFTEAVALSMRSGGEVRLPLVQVAQPLP